MRKGLRTRFWVEAGLAALSLFFAILTFFWTEWIEFLFGIDPDGGSGALEWAFTFGLLALAIIVGVVARIEWRRTAPATT